jgi:hypothetical protein
MGGPVECPSNICFGNNSLHPDCALSHSLRPANHRGLNGKAEGWAILGKRRTSLLPVSGTGQVGGIPAPLAIACNRGVPRQPGGRIFPSGENAPNHGEGSQLDRSLALPLFAGPTGTRPHITSAILGMTFQLPDTEKLGPARCCLAW